jgi:trigger factor
LCFFLAKDKKLLYTIVVTKGGFKMSKTKEIKIKVEGEKWQKAIENAYKKVEKDIKIDGFRKGHAPKDIILKKYGEQNLWLDAADQVIADAYAEMVEANKDLEIVTRPDGTISAISNDYVEFLFTLTLRPDIKLGEYKKLGIKKDSVKVTDKEVEESLENMRKRYAENVVKEGKVENGDTAIIDFEGFKDGVAFDGGKGENYSLTIGSNTFIPGFEEQIIGMEKGEEKDINVTFPEDYHAEDLKGAKVVFKVKVNEIKTTKIPELDKDFFEDLGMEGINDEKSLKEELKKTIEARKEKDAENKFIDEVLDKAVANMEVEIPHAMIHDELDRMLSQYEENLAMQGITLQQFYQFTASNEQALKDQMHPEAERRVASRFLLEEIAKKEKIEIEQSDVEEETKKLAEAYGMSEEEFLKTAGGKEMIEYDLKMRKAIELLKDNN